VQSALVKKSKGDASQLAYPAIPTEGGRDGLHYASALKKTPANEYGR
jgi:hypothetical protein